jgi:ADP-heptose:LPS heptosyltransferase
MSSITLGTKNRTLGDALILTTLPAKLKAAYPHLKVEVFVRGLNPWVFLNHPQVDGWSRAPRAVYGDDTNLGEGHLIQQKERGFGLEISEDPRPEIYLTMEEIRAAKALIENRRKSKLPIIALHPAGHTEKNVAERESWARVAQALGAQAEVWQVGLEGDTPLPSIQQTAFFPRTGQGVRQLFAFFSRIQGFVGVDSGPMHVAKSQGVPACIVTRHADVAVRILHQNFRFGFLYLDHTHLPVEQLLRDPAVVIDWWEKNR